MCTCLRISGNIASTGVILPGSLLRMAGGTFGLTAVETSLWGGLPLTLRDAAVRADWSAWTQSWQALDAGAVSQALQRLRQGEPVTLSLCGERGAQRYEARPIGLMRHLSQALRRKSAQQTLSEL